LTLRKLHFLFILFLFLDVSLQGQITSKKYLIDRVEFEGNTSFSSRELQKLVKLKKPRLTKSSEFNRRSLKLDAITLKNFYISRGFLKVSVEESFTISEYDRVDVLFRIHEGDRSYLRSVTIDGNSSFPDDRIMKIVGLKIVKPFNPIGLRQGFSKLEHEYGTLGKLLVTIDPSYLPGKDIHLSISIQEGPTVKIDKILIEGLEKVDSSLVVRELRIHEGTVYNENLVELTQRQIFETGLFSFVDIFPVKSKEGEDQVDIRMDLREFTTKELLIEPGISRIRPSSEGGEPISGVEGSMRWLDRSIFSSGSRFGMEGSVQLPVEAVEQAFGKAIFRGEANLSSVWIYRLRAPSTLRLFIERAPFEDQFLLRYWGEWRGLHKFTEESTFRGGIRLARIITREEDEDNEEKKKKEKEQERSLRFSYRYRNLDNPIIPLRGTHFSVESSIVGLILGGDQHYYRLEFDYRRFFLIGSSRVLALRAKFGRMESLTLQDSVPPYNQFFLGGSTSLRGWQSQEFIKDEDGDPKGGLIKVLVNAEFRIPIWWIFGFDLFIDGGILVDRVKDVSKMFQEWLEGKGWNYGVELTVSTPLGPVRLYYAVPFDQPSNWGIGVPYAF